MTDDAVVMFLAVTVAAVGSPLAAVVCTALIVYFTGSDAIDINFRDFLCDSYSYRTPLSTFLKIYATFNRFQRFMSYYTCFNVLRMSH